MERDFISRRLRSPPGAHKRRRGALGLASPPADIEDIEAFQRDHNANVYRRERTARRYGRDVLLTRGEAAVLLRYQPAFAGKDVLDIGVGPGRTTAYLAPLAKRYQAIDYSSVMVARFRQTFPHVALALADMAEMGIFENASFDFVLAADNVLDAVGHAERLRTLQEIRRVLRPGGTLVFSSHNRDVRGLGRPPALQHSRNPVTQLVWMAHWCMALASYARLAQRQLFTDEYAIVANGTHGGVMLLYCIGPDKQRRQLAGAGFELLGAFDQNGQALAPGDPGPQSHWVLYVATRTRQSNLIQFPGERSGPP